MTTEKGPELTPLLRQYHQIKLGYPDAILFFRLGDFYEMFYEDAVLASKVLEIALTTRDKRKEDPVPLCGIPYHAASSYISRLIRAGHNVAICEQIEDPKLAKGIVRREVIRVITPGTHLDSDMLEPKDNHFLCALFTLPGNRQANRNPPEFSGMAFVDLSTGEFYLQDVEDSIESLMQEIARIDPREVLYPSDLHHPILSKLKTRRIYLNPRPPETFQLSLGTDLLTKQFGTLPQDNGDPQHSAPAVRAAGALLQFLHDTQKTALSHMTTLKVWNKGATLGMDEAVQRSLGLVSPKASLFHILDFTETPMGGRLLRFWILHPLLDLAEIHSRQEGVEEFLERLSIRKAVQGLLHGISDLERILGRITMSRHSPRDLAALSDSLGLLPAMQKALADCQSHRFVRLSVALTDLIPKLSPLREGIRAAIVDAPPATLSDGGVIRPGYSPDLDEIRRLSREGKGFISRLEVQERQRSGIDSLKIGYNRVFGYYIEISKTRLKNVPIEYQRRQTLVNAERFVTPELKDYEEKVVGAEERCREIETTLFEALRENVVAEIRCIQTFAGLLAEVDTLSSLAEAAHRHHYTKPLVEEGLSLRISDGRHPVVELLNPGDGFVPNDTEMTGQERQIMVITGPNMAGKSTYMRQVALIVLMAQMGSYVPARESSIGIVDRIFTRIGASDNLVEGRSTFMVEMEEAAAILKNATSRSLVLLDEIGRGTSTFDGISIAWAVVEYLRSRTGARTLFATHYHELTELALLHEGIFNAQMLVREWNEEVIFLRKLSEGPADQSYGIQVARLAGLPLSVIQRAKEILANLENEALTEKGVPRLSQSRSIESEAPTDLRSQQTQMPLFHPPQHPLVTELQNMETLNMTPLEALVKLDELKKKARYFS